MKRIFGVLTVTLLLLALPLGLCACNSPDSEKGSTQGMGDTYEEAQVTTSQLPEEVETQPSDTETDGMDYVRMSVAYTDAYGNERGGDILIKLCPDKAPLTVKNFKKLVGEGFYDGLIFHRVVSGFMIQGGDPKGNGTGGTGPIRGEFAANGIQNDLSHTRGVISMARRGNDYDSGSCQFFIVHETKASNIRSLDGLYASFGYVVEGIEHVDGIAGTATNANNKPISTATIVRAVLEAEPLEK